ncbi:MAG: HAD hydrolase-like protein [Patescibacteria group bacterium]|jgi:putative hydrolase of the HAD superfamily
MIKTIIFDIDGMIIKREMYFSQYYSQKFKVPIEKMLPFYNNKFQLCLIGKADLKKEIAKYLNQWKWKKSVDDFLLLWFKYESNLDNKVLESIKKLRKKKINCYIGTDNEKYRVNYLLNNLKLAKYFDGIFASSKIGYQKSQQEFWSQVYKSLKQPNKSEILFWDDDPKNVKSAQDFGFNAKVYTNFSDYENKIKLLINI